MFERGEFGKLNFEAQYTISRDLSSKCNGFYRSCDLACIKCITHEECEAKFITEFGYAGRPLTLLKEYFYIAPYFYKYILPKDVTNLFPYIIPTYLSPKMRSIAYRQLRVVYKMKVYGTVFSWWQIRRVKVGTMIKYYSRLPHFNSYFEWFNDDQLKRVSLAIGSLISRVRTDLPKCIIVLENSGWLSYQIKNFLDFLGFKAPKIFLIRQHGKESDNILASMSQIEEFIKAQQNFEVEEIQFPTVKVFTIFVGYITFDNLLKVLGWIKSNRIFIRYVIAFFDSFKIFQLLQCYLHPLTIAYTTENVHFQFISVLKVVRNEKAFFVRNSVFDELAEGK